ncbi:paraquat-inducible protein A [Frateuria terrea]|uniref:Paraquat-inducible protein A n=1 Tax=Frateuria terrea TaxID=529704 RepID=A0A1H6QTZ4_9GAMM|nr:paraquat-inducible protein A [Frateuria terrea]SEI42940.1 paraquat-inducible protein A [Frateuria terrea]SFP08251.1 paraquat-inducible protein A [Frateuria terrea]
MSTPEHGLASKHTTGQVAAAWLRASPGPLLICEHCDTVHRGRALARGEEMCCVRCGALLQRYHALDAGGMLALVLTALLVFLIANVWPVVTLGLGTQQSSATLWGMILRMWSQGSEVIAVVAAATLFFFPLNKMLMLGWVLLFARDGRRAPGFVAIMRTLYHLQPWTMTEVFVLGALVSIVKARAYFDVQADPGIWAYGVLTFLITIFSGIDLRRLWDTTERRA